MVMRAVIVAVLLFCLAAPFSAFALEAGNGSYEFTDPETKKTQKVWYYKPADFTAETPVIMVLHGVKRNADTYCESWTPHANANNLMLLVPEFSMEAFPDVNGYNLGNYFAASTKEELEGLAFSWKKNSKSVWSYRVLDKVFADFAAKREKTKLKKYYLYGHSAGSQYVHRMLQFVPEAKVKLAVTANSGWYTMPDTTIQWPYGLKGTDLKEASVKQFLSMPLVVLLGEDDTNPKDRVLRHTPEADAQGEHRFARGQYFFSYGQKKAKELKVPFGWRLQTVPGVGHNDKGMAATAASIFVEDAKLSMKPAQKKK